jgi:hypothetical protein
LVLAIVSVVFAEHLGSFYIKPQNDYDPVFKVMDADGNSIFQVNTTTDGAAVTGALSVSGELTASSTLNFTTTVMDTNAFTTTAQADTVVISGALATDYYLLCTRGTSAPDTTDVLSYEAKAGSLIVHRPAGGTSGQQYLWLRLK